MRKHITYLKHPRMVKVIQPKGPPELMGFLRCNNAGIEWYGTMLADSPLVDPKGKRPLEPSEGEDATQEAINPMTDNQPPH